MLRPEDFDEPLSRAAGHARRWLAGVPTRHVAPRATADSLAEVFGGALPAEGLDPAETIDLLASAAEPGLTAMGSGRFYGFVIGGTLPAAMAADWLVSAWDQNAGLRFATPAAVAAEEAAGRWVVDLLGLPAGADVGFTTGASMANFSGLAAARWRVLERAGWDVNARGLAGAPRVRVLVGAERHDTVDMALRMLGLGAPEAVEVDSQGRIRPDALRARLQGAGSASDDAGVPTIVCLQAGNLHSGAFDPFREAVEAARDHGAWVHIDGAFGLWAAASSTTRHLMDGAELADSWGTDAHKNLNVPYDCGIVVCRDIPALRTALGMHGDYLMHDPLGGHGPGDPFEKVPELSRRARGVTVWAALRSLGRSGVDALVAGLVGNARELARRIAALDGVEVLNDVVFSQVCLAFGSDERTQAVADWLVADGRVWMTGSRWHGRSVLRISVANWSTDAADVEASVAAVHDALTATADL
ncbi:aspartate aminotransferase family protein [Sinomonas cellulolyticus]|uniref:Aspartate aminotransferase family protein n=1 Tax=Sinomonas cellulolyticus TaxID=2801916 RepID=A0ABS1K5E5_9MICC|nr:MULTISPECIES: pyridoxal-dependent decarboxylase [Sinomonas]MBL0706693.1 aspartate aminotransferase family protein [Sinomonas cellulolyticus]GHG56196.1 aspartate aminotransferase family protein [Sinomonas sp. KCTC 49339]